MTGYLEPLDRAQRGMYLHHPVWHQDLGSEEDATRSFQHLLRRGGHPEADDAEAFKHPIPGWHQSQLGRGDVGQLTAVIHPDRWNYGTLAHETAHALHQLHTGEKPASLEHAHDDGFMEHYRNVGNMISPGAGDALHEAYHRERYGSRLGFRQAAPVPLYHGTSRDLTSVEPADRHGRGEVFSGLTRTDRAYATHDPQMARTYAEISALDTGGRPRVYHVEHNGPSHALEPDPGYDADVMSPHGFRVLREVPERELATMPRHAAQERFRCPCGIPVEYDPSDGWQHADGSIGHDGEFYPHSVSDLMEEFGGHTAGKGKPRRDAPDVARRTDQAAQGPSGRMAPDPGRDDDGGESPAPLRALAEHPKVARDLAKLPRNVQAAYHERVDSLRRGEAHPSTHALTGPLKGWQGTSLNFLNRVVHRYDGGELHVLSAGNHDEAYDQGARRLGKHLEDGGEYTFKHVEHPLWGQPAIVAHHPDAPDTHGFTNHAGHIFWHRDQKHVGLVYVDPDHQRRGLATELWNRAKAVEPEIKHSTEQTDAGRGWAATVAKLSRYSPPRERLFGPTFGLDTRLWDEDQNLRDSVRMDVITRFDAFCHNHGYEGWHRWAKIVFFGSEASEWTSRSRVGNGDFDLSIGIHYPALRAMVPGFDGLADEIIAAGMTQEMHAELNDPQHEFPGVPGTFDMTWYANLQGWDIARIRPYAAYDVVADEWIVRPPHLPDWSMQSFPEGEGLVEEVHGIVLMAEGILRMPEPYRTQNGAALWEFVHSNRSDAFGESGEGWWDARNVVEKALDQKGLMQKLWECHDRAQQAPESLASPSDWSNSPVATR